VVNLKKFRSKFHSHLLDLNTMGFIQVLVVSTPVTIELTDMFYQGILKGEVLLYR
jgi:hypothetical protein